MFSRIWMRDAFKIILPALLALTLFVLAIVGFFLPSFRSTAMGIKKEMIRELTQTAWNILSYYHSLEAAGQMSRSKAQTEATKQIRRLRYGEEGKDYFWITDLNSVVVMHPYRPDLEGQDMSSFTDPTGKQIFVAFVDTVKTRDAGYVPYMWQWHDDPLKVVPKLSYVKGFRPWGWIIGTGIYIEDVRAETNAITLKLTMVSAGILLMVALLSAYLVRQSLIALDKRRQAEESIKISEAKYRELVENANSIILRMDSSGVVTFFNEFAEKFFGYSREEIIGRCVVGTIVPDTESTGRDLKKMIQEISRNPEKYNNNENENMRRSGQRVWVSWTNRPIYDQRGQVTEVLCIGNDVTQKRQTEEALAASEKKYRMLVENMSDGLIMIDVAGHFTYANDRFCQIVGYTREELEGVPCTRLLDEKNGKIFEKEFDKRRAGREDPYELEWTKKDGTRAVTLMSPKRISDDSDRFWGSFAVVTDVTERRKAEEERFRLALAVKQIDEAVVVFAPDFTVQYVNPAFEDVFGLKAESLFRDFSDKEENGAEDIIWQVSQVIQRGRPWKGHFQGHNSAGRQLDIEVSLSLVREESNQVVNYVLVARDITKELILERQLRQSQKMEAIGALAGGIAHDFNNILSSIIGYSELARRSLPQDAQPWADLGEVLEAANRAKELVRQILTFSRQGEQEWKPLRLTPIIKEGLRLLKGLLPSTIEIRQNIALESDLVLTDPTQIHQVLINLCTNAFHAMREKGGILEVSLEEAVMDLETASLLPEVTPGSYLCLRVKDTGHGIDPSIIDRIFDPFFTTKGRGEGTGMGLSVVHGIVKSHGGTIKVKSEPGQGTTFMVLLPRFEGEAGVEEQGLDIVTRGRERILFVDDEPAVAQAWYRVLVELGYEVTVTTSSQEALDLFRTASKSFDLVITDQTMPYMTGMELAEKLMEIRKDLPLILCTGFSELVGAEEARALGVKEFVMKPMTVAQMAATIRRVLGRPS